MLFFNYLFMIWNKPFVIDFYREKVLHRWVKMISKTPVTISMYEERSFLRDPNLLTFLIQILESLKDFKVVLEASLIKGIDLWVILGCHGEQARMGFVSARLAGHHLCNLFWKFLTVQQVVYPLLTWYLYMCIQYSKLTLQWTTVLKPPYLLGFYMTAWHSCVIYFSCQSRDDSRLVLLSCTKWVKKPVMWFWHCY